MIERLAHDDVTQWRFSSRTSRMAGYTASAFLTAGGVLIDTGIPACRRQLATLLDATEVRGVVVTHHHEDHAGNVALVAERGIPLWLAPETRTLVTQVAPVRAYRRLTWTSMRSLRTEVMPFDPTPLVVQPAPGHCADHHVVWDPATRTLFSADLFLGVAVRLAHHDEDLWAGIASLEAAAALEPVRMFCAHRGLVSDPAATLRAKAAWTRRLIETVAIEIQRGATDAQIMRSAMGGESLTGRASRGEYSRRNFVRAVRTRVQADQQLDRTD